MNDDGTSETRNSGELFWALRGGGGGTFGVVVHYVLKLHLAPESFVSVFISTTFYQNDSNTIVAEDFLDMYNNWTKTAPSHWGGYLYFNNVPSSGIVSLNNTSNTTYHNTGQIRGFLNKFRPWDGSEESEIQQFYDLKNSYPLAEFVNIQLFNHTSLWGDYMSKDPMYGPYTREYTLGALIPPEKHDDSLRDFFVNEFMDGNNGQVHCYIVRLGGESVL